MNGCRCLACTVYGRAYLHHLFRARETLHYRLASLHNLTFVQDLMVGIRAAIIDDTFAAQRATFLERYQPANQAAASAQRAIFMNGRPCSQPPPASSRPVADGAQTLPTSMCVCSSVCGAPGWC